MTDINDPYFREDPGEGIRRTPFYNFDLESKFDEWKPWRTNDGRVLPNSNSGFELITNPFDPGSLIKLTNTFDPGIAGKSFGGFGMRAKFSSPVELNDNTYVEFGLYYPKSAAGKYMRFEIWSTSSGGEGSQADAGYNGHKRTQIYIRRNEMNEVDNPNPAWIGFYQGETWYKKTLTAVTPVSSGTWEYLNIDIHSEIGIKLENDLLLIGNIRLTQAAPDAVPLPNIVNEKLFSEVTPIKEKYNPENGYFYVGTVGTGNIPVNSIRDYHYDIITDANNLKPEIHLHPPEWLRDEFPDFTFKSIRNRTMSGEEEAEWILPDEDHLKLKKSERFAGKEYKLHGHCLAWYNQSPSWMMQIIPETLKMEWNKEGLFYSGGNSASGPYLKLNTETARRVYFDHIVYLLRHLMSTDTRYDSSKERGIIPFYSFDVLNEEVHESWHMTDSVNWRIALKNTSWLMAMTGSSVSDIRQHYIYLLFKFAHIAVPNAQMAAKYKAGYDNPDIVPSYMRLNNHDNGGSIDAYIAETPPILTYNDFHASIFSKAQIMCNMVKELNMAWQTDPLYDGRHLIECVGIQGHDMVEPSAASRNLQVVSLFTGLIDEGLLNYICYSEFDIKQFDGAPGGQAFAPDILNQKQADAIGYQCALLFKIFEKFKKYFSHVIFWGEYGTGWHGSYVPFDHEKKASQIYYAIMDPDKFIKGHSYLDEFFKGEYDKVK
ncbi:MAG: endo-1,4-beta-xylanase [Treponema sp.]|jgi:GH35 family endo-1,4-beta-xylanase|nr:endo-1,4-beta-xylanase [Treponema sp.]